MAITPILASADIALFSDLTRRVALPRVSAAQPRITYPGVGVRFSGDTRMTAFRGEGAGQEWPLTVRYGPYEQQLLVDVLKLFADAAVAPDTRLFLRTNYGVVAGLDAALAVVVFDIQPGPQFGRHHDLAFTAQAVEYTLAV